MTNPTTENLKDNLYNVLEGNLQEAQGDLEDSEVLQVLESLAKNFKND